MTDRPPRPAAPRGPEAVSRTAEPATAGPGPAEPAGRPSGVGGRPGLTGLGGAAARPAGARPSGNGGGDEPPDLPPSAACKELDVLIRARYPIIYVVSWEEERVEQQLAQIARQRNKKFFVWTLTQGLVKHGAAPAPGAKGGGTTDPIQALN
ncbi:MAG TPA: hypothetical protein VIL46_18160 [Gemmataceae bacterium]